MGPKMNDDYHTPVLLQETIDFLNIKPGGVYLDATLGGGGHSQAILKQGGKILGIDCDSDAIEFSQKRLANACPAPNQKVGGANAVFKLVNDNFVNLDKILKKANIDYINGALFDLGTSLHQLKDKSRGFSFSSDEILDMRMDSNLSVKAADLINGLGRKELYDLFSRFGQEKLALPIVKAILLVRKTRAINTTKQLADIICQVYQQRRIKTKIHPATKAFQALRIVVNDELNNIKIALPKVLDFLEKNGRLVAISFHELEDGIVKNFFKQEEQKENLKILTKKPIKPKKMEVINNPRSRSAKLRCAEKI